jgi:hypothetical protein
MRGDHRQTFEDPAPPSMSQQPQKTIRALAQTDSPQ